MSSPQKSASNPDAYLVSVEPESRVLGDTAPPLYFQNVDRDNIHPSEKTPAFPIPESSQQVENSSLVLNPIANAGATHIPYANSDNTLTYFASNSTPGILSHAPSSAVPPPPAFSRAPPADLPYPSFKPIFISSIGKTLDKGWPMAPPPSTVRPHPFISHDVSELDWLSFLKAIHLAGSLTEKDMRRSHLPIISIIPIVNEISAYGVQAFMKSHKSEKVIREVNIWNHHFFEPRKLKIILMKGNVKLTGFAERSMADIQVTSTPGNLISGPDDGMYRLFVVPTIQNFDSFE